MKKTAFVLLLAFTAFAHAAGPSAKQILEKAIDALGGKANLEKQQTRIATAKVEVRGLTGTFQSWAKSPDKLKTLLDLGVVKQERAFDGTVGWQKQASLEEIAGNDLFR